MAMGDYVALDVEHISMVSHGDGAVSELVACRRTVKVDNPDVSGAYALVRGLYQDARIELCGLRREIATARELLQDMMEFFVDGDYCARCSVAERCDADEQYESGCLMQGVFADRMRKLGIEVG